MSNLIDDGHLIGFWPLHEASGTPYWKNFSPARAGKPSGISFDLHLIGCDFNTILDDDSAQSHWPGKEIITGASGSIVQGLKLRGQHLLRGSNTSYPFSFIPTFSDGSNTIRSQTLGPPVAQSGFTVGIWVYPRTDGWITAHADGGFSPGSVGWSYGYARSHNLVSQFDNVNTAGWYMGVSGQLDGATPDGVELGGPHQLRGFLHIHNNLTVTFAPDAANTDRLDTPIERDRYTHLTMSFRYVDGTSNQVAFYKDGRLAASGITNVELAVGTLGASTDYPIALGASHDGGFGTDGFEFTSGWGHLVSGFYSFNRVLDEGEILNLHECGGLQPDFSLRDNMTPVDVTDPTLIAYIENKSPGYIDSSNSHNNFISSQDAGDRGIAFTPATGPFGTVANYMDIASGNEYIIAPSGACFGLADAPGGFTISTFQSSAAITNARDDNFMLSMGSVSTSVSGPATATVSNSTMCLALTYYTEGTEGERVVLEAYPVGDLSEDTQQLRGRTENMYRNIFRNYTIVYDAGSRGLALYLDGGLHASGTLTHNLQDQMARVAGSGFPLVFKNGITNQTVASATHGMHSAGGRSSLMGPTALFSRPLRADEIRYIANSGIDTSSIWRTRQDPRLFAYWKADDASLDGIYVEDKARAFSPVLGHLTRGESITKWNTAYGGTGSSEAAGVFREDRTPFVDLFNGEERSPDALQATFGNLGITSGVFSVHGGSFGAGDINSNLDSRSSASNFVARYAPYHEARSLSPQCLFEYIISYEVTPSGNIPVREAMSHVTNSQKYFNSTLHIHGNTPVDGEVSSFLTTLNSEVPDLLGAVAGTGGSGVTLCFVGVDGNNGSTSTPIISGTLPYGVPSKVLFHAKFELPYDVTNITAGDSPITCTLWIDGARVNVVTRPVDDLRLWTNLTPDANNSEWLMQFGGSAATNAVATQIFTNAGLGEIYLREIFLMRGLFEEGEVEALAASGIQNPSIAGYNSQLPTTQVSIADSNLEGYWRFNGFDGNIGQVSNSPGGSGTTDLSSKNNHLDAIAQVIYEDGTSVDAAESLVPLSGPFRNSDLGVQCSGFHNRSQQPASTAPNAAPIFAVSGASFNSPQDGFSIGFFMAKKEDVANSRFDCILSYGVLTSAPNGLTTDTSVHPNRGWAIGMDDSENIKMIISTGGNMYIDNTANGAQSGQLVCGIHRAGGPMIDGSQFNKFTHQGEFVTPALDYWNHYCWVYDPDPVAGVSGLRMYLNGQLVNEALLTPFQEDGFAWINPWTGTSVVPQTPVTPEARIISMRSHQSNSLPAWDFRQVNLYDADSVMTDLFYFSRALSEEEVRYVVQNGIDDAVGVPTSGVPGGFIHGQDSASGVIGGYSRGIDTASGVIGGYMPGGLLGSGLIGGYISGVVFGDGTIGGFIQGQDIVSGVMAGYIQGVDVGSGMIAGYIRGQEVGSGVLGGLILAGEAGSGVMGGLIFASDQSSGVMGGYMLGGLEGNMEFDAGFTVSVLASEDFDAQVEIAKTVSSDFDAKLVIFQDEIPPLVDIIIPDDTVTMDENGNGLEPPFNQYFIAKASGQQGKSIVQTRWNFGDLTPNVSVAESGAGCYPVQHQFTGSGFYIVKFEAVDSDGMHASATRIINSASGVEPVIVSLSGVPRSGNTGLVVDFTTTVDIIPTGVSLSTQLLNFDDGQTTTSFDPTHVYGQPGTYKPIWCVRDSRGVIWCDSLEAGSDIL